MRWQEARELFPNQFILVSILDYHEEGDKKIVDEVEPIRSVSEKNANKEFFHAKEGTMVYYISNRDFIIHLRRDSIMKVRRCV